jgi:hypothetical protein
LELSGSENDTENKVMSLQVTLRMRNFLNIRSNSSFQKELWSMELITLIIVITRDQGIHFILIVYPADEIVHDLLFPKS